MILSSPAKPRTTRLSTDLSKASKLILCALALGCCLSVSATLIAAEKDDPFAQPAKEDDPIERLRRRSAVERWKALSDGWTNREARSSQSKKSESKPSLTSGPRMQPAEAAPRLEPVETVAPPTAPAFPSRPELQPESFNSPVARKSTEAPVEPDAKPDSIKNHELYYRTAKSLKQNDEMGITEDAYKIKKVTEINPFNDYEPDPTVAAEEPCRNLCPTPEDCSESESGEFKVCPEIEPLTNEEYVQRYIPPAHYAWAAPNHHYNPLYFEDVPLERYGHTYWEPIQPLVSIGKFGVQLVGLPYQMAIDPPHKKIYPLGYYRPGECAPKLHYQVPLNAKAAAVQAGATAGAILLVP